jgi:hypothetical protein
MTLLIVQLAIDFIILSKNGQIKEKYWQLELLAIKATFNKQEGKRSKNSNLHSKLMPNNLNKKQEK